MPSLSVSLVGGLLVAAVLVSCQTSGGAGGASPQSRGERFFLLKCNSCHPNGGQGAGPPIDAALAPTFLERGKATGRHGVPEAEWEPLIAYITQRFGAPAPAAVAMTVPAPTVAPTVAPTPPTPAPPTAGDPARGERWYQAKCNRCHPNGGRGVGPAVIGGNVPGPLKSAATGGRHDVPPDEYAHLMSYLAVLTGGATAPTAPIATAPAVATPAAPPPAATTPVAAVASGDPAAGSAYYQARCNKCHPGGGRGVGPAIAGKALPGILKPAVTGGRHDVQPDQMENLLAYLVTLGGVRGGTVAAAPTATTVAPPATPPVSTPATGGTIPNNAGMVPCTCNCQCPPGAPPAALPAACICQCSCPR